MLPPGVCIVLIVAGLIWHKRILAWLGVLLLCVLSVPLFGNLLVQGVEWPYRRIPVERVRQVDAIVVLSGMINQVQGAPLGEWNDKADRFEGGVELFKAGKAPLLVFTNGEIPWQDDEIPEGKLLAKRALLWGVPSNSIRMTGYAPNTASEAVEVSKLLDAGKSGRRRVLLVTSAHHMRRAAMQFRRAGLAVDPYPVDFETTEGLIMTPLIFLPDATTLGLSALAIREMIGFGFYLAKAQLEDMGVLRRY